MDRISGIASALLVVVRTLGATVPVAIAALLLGAGPTDAMPGPEHVRARLGSLRVPFIANQGQADPRVAYYAPTFDGTLFVTQRGELVHVLGSRSSVTETLVGGRPRPVPRDPTATGVSEFRGADPARWPAARSRRTRSSASRRPPSRSRRDVSSRSEDGANRGGCRRRRD